MPDSESFSWERYAAALTERGLAPDDVAVVIGEARRAVALFATDGDEAPPLLPLVAARFDLKARELLLGALLDAQTRGPAGTPAREVWRELYVEGCPLDRIWSVLRECLRDPASDNPEDWQPVETPTALGEARRYVALAFPRAAGPWPGLGCTNTIACVRERLDLFAAQGLPASHGAEELVRARAVVSAALGQIVDAKSQIRDDLGAALDASTDTGLAPALDAWIEEEPRDALFALARRWVDVLDELRAAGLARHDLAGDRFVGADEPLTAPILSRRPDPAPPADHRAALRALLAPWDAAFTPPWGKEEDNLDRLLDARDHTEPLAWLGSVAELALLAWDEETSCARVREVAPGPP